jgi:tetratricopeptide (TPR) repeat protein
LAHRGFAFSILKKVEIDISRTVLCSVILILLATPVCPAENPVTLAMTLYKKNHYQEAASILRNHLDSYKTDQRGASQLGLGLIYLKNAQLHRELYLTSLSVHLDYLKKLTSLDGKARSKLGYLYLGEVILEGGKPSNAVGYLKKSISIPNIEKKYREIATINLGLCYYLQGDKTKAKDLWNKVTQDDPEVNSELAAAFSRANITGQNPETICEKAIETVKRSGDGIPSRITKNALGVYVKNGNLDKGFDLLELTRLKAYSSEEVIGKYKVLHFYDLALLHNMAKLYGKASIELLIKATADKRSRDLANYYLGEAYAVIDRFDKSVEATSAFLESSKAPERLKMKAEVCKVNLLYSKGEKVKARNLFMELLNKHPNSPDLLADILHICSRFSVKCDKISLDAEAIAKSGEGKKVSGLNFALGKYYLSRKDYKKAISYMEAARDKSNKNKIEYNDPLLLIHLAEAYYKNKQFSEALEIYFSLSKPFPVVRQIQGAMQGVYSMEQKSAGDVKIF